MVEVKLRRLAHAAGLPLPSFQSDRAAGFDLAAAVDEARPVTVPAGARAVIPTGFAMELPAGYEGQVRPRSGLALTHGVTVLNAPGTIDADYRGEIGVILVNHGDVPYVITRGMRIAQLVIGVTLPVTLREAEELSGTSRGEGGFGSTGMTSRRDQGE